MKIKRLLSLLAIICIAFAGSSLSASAAVTQNDASLTKIETRGVPFKPDRCINVKRILPGWDPGDGFTDIEAQGGAKYRLYDSNKVGWKSIKVGGDIEIMLGANGQIFGWRVL
ncbi:hypothetical protein [Lysinibacillus xylanilyticus]|uniref:Uncharacterized protein n=1 Tax=Lysinibacillus xylanilyticus TaxID=582475 RepID=A0ABT4F0G1_9BACI|nr:hypothetical protein [Lysinibacillus xylanilyticus]MCY9550021.1 hypothetical protein [Lysinibacillus xylanilyticus]